MNYRVEVTSRAKREIAEFARYVAVEKQEPLNAERLLEAVYDAIPTLRRMPNRCPKAPESRQLCTMIRMLAVKRTLVVLFVVDESERSVRVVGFRHASHLPLEFPEFES